MTDLAMHIANKPAPEVTARVVELLGGSKAVAAWPQQLQNFLNEICQTFWHNAGGPTELTAADLRKRLNSVSKHLQAANDLINSDLMIAGAVQSVFTMPRPDTATVDFARAMVALDGLQTSAATAAAVANTNRNSSVQIKSQLMRDVTIPGRSDAADAQHWAAYQILELVEIFSNRRATMNSAAPFAAALLPFLQIKYGRRAMNYRRALHQAVVEFGGDPIALADQDPTGDALRAALPRGHAALDLRPPATSLDVNPFVFSAETAAVICDNEWHNTLSHSERRDQSTDYFRNHLRHADRQLLELGTRAKNRETILYGTVADFKNPTALFSLAYAAQGAYRAPGRDVLHAWVRRPLELIAAGIPPVAEIGEAGIEWRADLDILRKLQAGRTASFDLIFDCRAAYLTALVDHVALNVAPEYLAKRNMAIPSVDCLLEETKTIFLAA